MPGIKKYNKCNQGSLTVSEVKTIRHTTTLSFSSDGTSVRRVIDPSINPSVPVFTNDENLQFQLQID